MILILDYKILQYLIYIIIFFVKDYFITFTLFFFLMLYIKTIICIFDFFFLYIDNLYVYIDFIKYPKFPELTNLKLINRYYINKTYSSNSYRTAIFYFHLFLVTTLDIMILTLFSTAWNIVFFLLVFLLNIVLSFIYQILSILFSIDIYIFLLTIKLLKKFGCL